MKDLRDLRDLTIHDVKPITVAAQGHGGGRVAARLGDRVRARALGRPRPEHLRGGLSPCHEVPFLCLSVPSVRFRCFCVGRMRAEGGGQTFFDPEPETRNSKP